MKVESDGIIKDGNGITVAFEGDICRVVTPPPPDVDCPELHTPGGQKPCEHAPNRQSGLLFIIGLYGELTGTQAEVWLDGNRATNDTSLGRNRFCDPSRLNTITNLRWAE